MSNFYRTKVIKLRHKAACYKVLPLHLWLHISGCLVYYNRGEQPVQSSEVGPMRAVVLELPPDVREALRIPVAEQEVRLRRELAIRLYEKGVLSFGKARELAGLSKWEFHELLAAEGVPRHYDLEELEADLQTLEDLQ
jgi:Uncharacterized small protein